MNFGSSIGWRSVGPRGRLMGFGVLLSLGWFTLKLSASSYALFRSFNQGVTWESVGIGLPDGVRVNGLARSSGGRYLAGTDAGVYLSQDLGGHWRLVEGTDLLMGRVLCLALAGEELLAGTADNGLWVSDEPGETWKRVDRESGFTGGMIRSVLGVGEVGVVGMEDGRVFRRMVRGGSWKTLGEIGPTGSQALALESVRGRLFAGLYARGLYEWNEKEERWLRFGEVSPLVLASARGNLLAGHNPGGIHGNGLTGGDWFVGKGDYVVPFEACPVGGTQALTDESPVWAMGSDGEWVIAGAGSGIYFSRDSGRSWLKGEGGWPEGSPGIAFFVGKDLVLAVTGVKPYGK